MLAGESTSCEVPACAKPGGDNTAGIDPSCKILDDAGEAHRLVASYQILDGLQNPWQGSSAIQNL